MEYDPAVDNVFTSCIHSFEAEELKGGRINFARAPVLKVDPALRCAAMLVYERKLVVIPFRQTGTEMDDEDDEIVAPSKKARTDAQGTATAGSGTNQTAPLPPTLPWRAMQGFLWPHGVDGRGCRELGFASSQHGARKTQ